MGSTWMQHRRSKLDIALIVLGAVQRGMDKPTRIMYAANLSWKPTQRILDNLVEQQLLDVEVEKSAKRMKKRYTITEKGITVLEYFEKAQALVDISALSLD